MAGYASLIGMAINFAMMFRIKFRFSTRNQLLVSGMVLIAANVICAYTASVPLLVGTCFVAGWFRMQATFACNSTIQLWLTPVRDMAIFFLLCLYHSRQCHTTQRHSHDIHCVFSQWEYMHWIMTGMLALMMLMVMILVKACARTDVHSFARHRLDRCGFVGDIHALLRIRLRLRQFL